MALLFWDGLDNYANVSEASLARTEVVWSPSGLLTTGWSTTGGRFGNNAFSITIVNGTAGNYFPSTSPFYYNSSGISDVWVGKAFYNRSQHESLVFSVSSDIGPSPANGVDTCVSVGLDGTVKLYKGEWQRAGSTLLANTGPGVLPAFQYRFVECRFKTDSSSGVVEVWIDNNRVINYTGNTKNTGSSVSNTIKSVFIAGPTTTGGTGNYNDDIYVLDTTGSNHANTRLGDLRISTILVNGDAGPNQLVTQNNSAQHWIAIDDDIPGANGLDYITGSSLNNNATEMFTHAAPPSTPNVIHAVMIQTIASKSDAGNGYFHPALSIAGTQYNVATKALSTTWTTYTDNWTTSPATGVRWTYGEFANANIGFVIDSF